MAKFTQEQMNQLTAVLLLPISNEERFSITLTIATNQAHFIFWDRQQPLTQHGIDGMVLYPQCDTFLKKSIDQFVENVKKIMEINHD